MDKQAVRSLIDQLADELDTAREAIEDDEADDALTAINDAEQLLESLKVFIAEGDDEE